MKYVPGWLFILLSPAIFAGEDFARIEADALSRASVYAREMNLIGEAIVASGKNGNIAHYSKIMTHHARKEESLVDHLKKVSQVVVFLSFSIPMESLEAWMEQCRKSGATPVIRGLINNSWKETFQAIHHLSQKTGIGIQIDPVLFKTFDIRQVPAVVFIEAMDTCPANMNCKPPLYDRIYGDVTLDYALEKIHSNSDVPERKILQEMIARIRGEIR